MKKKFDKYWYYRHSVQSPELDLRFMRKCYRTLRRKEPYVFREDFCSTFALSCEWVKMGPLYKSVAVDIDSQPLKYGKEKYLLHLKPHQQKRVRVINTNVLNKNTAKADIIGALNFSYFTFKKRVELKKYFFNCLKLLNSNGLLIIDCFGGTQCFEKNEEQTDYGSFIYFWDQRSFDPITHHSLFHIHYKRKGEKKQNRAFSYNWRLWMIPELKDLLQEVGFHKVHIYWEGTDKKGEGNGHFTRRKKGEECESWIAYIVSEK